MTTYAISNELQTKINETADPAGELFAISDMAQNFADLSGWDLEAAMKRDGMIRTVYTPTKTLRAVGVGQIHFERNPQTGETTVGMTAAILWEMSSDMIELARASRMREEIINNEADLTRSRKSLKGRNAHKNLWARI